jgi:hypothetical protein
VLVLAFWGGSEEEDEDEDEEEEEGRLGRGGG